MNHPVRRIYASQQFYQLMSGFGMMPYGLFRASHFHNPAQYSHIVGL